MDAATACFTEQIESKDHPFGDQLQPTRGVLSWVEFLEGKKKVGVFQSTLEYCMCLGQNLYENFRKVICD